MPRQREYAEFFGMARNNVQRAFAYAAGTALIWSGLMVSWCVLYVLLLSDFRRPLGLGSKGRLTTPLFDIVV